MKVKFEFLVKLLYRDLIWNNEEIRLIYSISFIYLVIVKFLLIIEIGNVIKDYI